MAGIEVRGRIDEGGGKSTLARIDRRFLDDALHRLKVARRSTFKLERREKLSFAERMKLLQNLKEASKDIKALHEYYSY